jgi:hypothetical protein
METMKVRPINQVQYVSNLLPDRPSDEDQRQFDAAARAAFDALGKRLCDFKSECQVDIERCGFVLVASMLEFEPLDS